MSREGAQTIRERRLRRVPVALALASAVGWIAAAPSALGELASAAQSATPPRPGFSATLEQCVTSANQAERSATFAGEMQAITGAAKLEMKIDVLERMPREIAFHAVSAPGLGVWRIAAPGVRSYRYLKEVTNLSAPALYRAAVHFRWLNGKGRLIRTAELKTARCRQPLAPATARRAAEGTSPAG